MKVLIQRVSHAQVEVADQIVGQIGSGILLFLGVDKGDGIEHAEQLADRVMNYRIFADDEGKMNLSLLDTQSELLVVSQFTLSANTSKGRRPSFGSAAEPALAKELYLHFINYCEGKVSPNASKVQSGVFAADMQVSLTNDGPVTFLLE